MTKVFIATDVSSPHCVIRWYAMQHGIKSIRGWLFIFYWESITVVRKGTCFIWTNHWLIIFSGWYALIEMITENSHYLTFVQFLMNNNHTFLQNDLQECAIETINTIFSWAFKGQLIPQLIWKQQNAKPTRKICIFLLLL